MKMSDIDLYHMPVWMGGIVDEVEETGRREMAAESPQYSQMKEESEEILEHFDFISTLIDRDQITHPMKMDVTEAKALSRFLALEEDMESLLRMKMYLMGCRHTLAFLELVGVL